MITTTATKYTGPRIYGWIGYVRVWKQGEPFKNISCEYLRQTKHDALKDAKAKKHEVVKTIEPELLY